MIELLNRYLFNFNSTNELSFDFNSTNFYGIAIRMYFLQSEHNPPHIHAIYNEDVAAIDFMTGQVLEGHLPNKAMDMVQEWIALHKDELMHIWETQEFKAISPLE